MTRPAPESFAAFYLDGPYGRFPQEHRTGGTLGVQMVDVRQGAIEATDPALPQFTLAGLRNAADRSGEVDFGDGWRTARFVRGVVDPQPANTECRFRIPDLHLLAMCIDRDPLVRHLDEAGAALATLEPICGTFEPMPDALALMERAWNAMEATGAAANLLVDAALSGVLGLMLARAGRAPAPPPRLDDRRLQRVIDYVEAHLAEPLTAGELAGVAHVSLFHFTRIFRDATGRTPHAYLQARRVERAKAMLRGGGAWPGMRGGWDDAAGAPTLAQIAFATGFASQSHFGAVFKAHTGASPGAYRAGVWA